jgi:hypothetical protein
MGEPFKWRNHFSFSLYFVADLNLEEIIKDFKGPFFIYLVVHFSSHLILPGMKLPLENSDSKSIILKRLQTASFPWVTDLQLK